MSGFRERRPECDTIALTGATDDLLPVALVAEVILKGHGTRFCMGTSLPAGPAIELAPSLRYRGIPTFAGMRRGGPRQRARQATAHECMADLGTTMSSTFDTVANIISETCDIPRDTIKPESHAINDLGIDSLDFLDIAFAIDKAFGIKMPLEQWTQEVNEGKATPEQYFQLDNLCTRIDELVAARGA